MDDLISNYIDRAAFSEDTKFAIDEIAKLEAAYKSLRDQKANLQGSVSTKDVSTNATAATESIKNLTAAIGNQNTIIGQAVKGQDDLAGSSKNLQKEQEKLNNLYTDDAKRIAELKVQQQQQTKANKEAAVETLGLTDAYQKLNKEYLDASKSAKALQAQAVINPQFKTEADAASAKAKGLADVLKTIDAGVGQFQRNVGNYTGAFSILKKGYDETKAKLDGLSESERNNTAEGQSLQKQTAILGTVTNQQSKGFTSLTSELRTSERALKTLFEQGLQGTSTFKELQTVVNDTTRGVREFTREQTLLSSESPVLAGLTAAARGLGGAYAVGAGAAALFGDENGKVEKELQKLVAIMTLLNGLTEFNRFLQEKGSIATALNGVKTAFLAAAQKLAAVATGQETVALAGEAEAAAAAAEALTTLGTAETAAVASSTELGVSCDVAAEGLTAEAGAAVELEAGLGGVVVAEEGVAIGAVSMATAIAATGIGLLIVGLAVGVYKIVEAIKDWTAASASQQKANEDLTGSMKDLVDATKEYETIRRSANDREAQELERTIALRKSSGLTALQSLALDKQIAQEKLKFANDDAKRFNVTDESYARAFANAKQDAAVVKIAENKKQDYINETINVKNKDYDDDIKRMDESIKKRKEEAQVTKGIFDFANEIKQRQIDATQQINDNTNQADKLSADDKRKFLLENTRIEVDLVTQKNNRVLNNEKSTLSQRLDALKSNLVEQRRLINAENNAIQKDPSISTTDKAIAATKANAQLTTARKDSDITLEKLKEDFRLRDLAADTEYNKSIFNDIAKTNEAILANDAITEKQRLESLNVYAISKRAVLNQDLNQTLSAAGISDTDIDRIKKDGFFEIANKKITDEELKKLIQTYNQSLVDLSRDSAAKRIAITKDYYQKEDDERTKALRNIQQQNDLLTEDKADTYNNQIISLQESYRKGIVDTDQYNEKKLDLDKNYAKQSIQIEIDKLEKQLAATKSAGETEIAIKKEIADIKNFVGPQNDEDKKRSADRLKVLDDELKKIQLAVGTETALYKQLSKLKKDLSQADTDTFTANQQKIIDALNTIKEKATEVFNVIAGALNATATAQKNRLQDQANAIDKNTQAEINAVNASVASAQDKAAKIIVINARAQSQKDAIALRQKKIDEDQARAQKAFAIFQIILETAIAIAKAHGNVAKIVFAAAIGAAELAVAIATPIPKFKHGKSNDYEGPAIVGDGGVPEYIEHADGSIAKTPAHDTLTWLNRTDIVHPDLMSMMRRFAMPAINGMPQMDNGAAQMSDFAQRVESAIQMQTPLLKQIANKKEFQIGADSGGMTALHRWGSRQVSYVDQNTNW